MQPACIQWYFRAVGRLSGAGYKFSLRGHTEAECNRLLRTINGTRVVLPVGKTLPFDRSNAIQLGCFHLER